MFAKNEPNGGDARGYTGSKIDESGSWNGWVASCSGRPETELFERVGEDGVKGERRYGVVLAVATISISSGSASMFWSLISLPFLDG